MLQCGYDADMMRILSYTPDSEKMQYVAEFLVRIRQSRRRLKVYFERQNETFLRKSYIHKKAAWKSTTGPVCRHGVFFTELPAEGCKCMSSLSTPADWQTARFMPALHHELKTIVAVPFQVESFQRIGLLQSRARQLGW